MAGDGSTPAAPTVVNPEGSVPEGPTGAASSGTAVAIAGAVAASTPAPTIFELAVKHNLPKALVDSLLVALEADADTSLEDILGVLEATMQEVIRPMKKGP